MNCFETIFLAMSFFLFIDVLGAVNFAPTARLFDFCIFCGSLASCSKPLFYLFGLSFPICRCFGRRAFRANNTLEPTSKPRADRVDEPNRASELCLIFCGCGGFGRGSAYDVGAFGLYAVCFVRVDA